MKEILSKNVIFSKKALFYIPVVIVNGIFNIKKRAAYCVNFYSFSLKSNFVFIYPNNQLKTVEVYEITSPKDRP